MSGWRQPMRQSSVSLPLWSLSLLWLASLSSCWREHSVLVAWVAKKESA